MPPWCVVSEGSTAAIFRAISLNSLTFINVIYREMEFWYYVYNFSKSGSVSFFRWKTVYLGLEYGNNAWQVRESIDYYYLRQSVWNLRLLKPGLCSVRSFMSVPTTDIYRCITESTPYSQYENYIPASLHTKYLIKYYDVTFFLFFSLALSYCVFALHSALFIYLKKFRL